MLFATGLTHVTPEEEWAMGKAHHFFSSFPLILSYTQNLDEQKIVKKSSSGVVDRQSDDSKSIKTCLSDGVHFDDRVVTGSSLCFQCRVIDHQSDDSKSVKTCLSDGVHFDDGVITVFSVIHVPLCYITATKFMMLTMPETWQITNHSINTCILRWLLSYHAPVVCVINIL